MTTLDSHSIPTHDEISMCAFLLWEKEGRQPGREMTYWLQAEAQLRMSRQQEAEAAAKTLRPWPPTTATKLSTARAISPTAPTSPKLETSRAKTAKTAAAPKSAVRKTTAAAARKAAARN